MILLVPLTSGVTLDGGPNPRTPLCSEAYESLSFSNPCIMKIGILVNSSCFVLSYLFLKFMVSMLYFPMNVEVLNPPK